jgi:hypothetical protein
MLTYVDLWQIFKLYNKNWYILAILLTGATVFGTSMGMLTVSPCYRFGVHSQRILKLNRCTIGCWFLGRSCQGQDDDGIRRQTALDLSESRERRVKMKLFGKLIRAALSSQAMRISVYSHAAMVSPLYKTLSSFSS